MLNRLGLGLGLLVPKKSCRPSFPNPPQGNRAQAIGILRGVGNHNWSVSHLWTRVTVFLCGIAIAVLGSVCHSPIVMLDNFIATPIELSLVFPFLRFGEFVTGGPQFTLTSDALKKVLTGQASKEVLQSIFLALLGWVVAAPFIFGALYVLCVPALFHSLGA